MDQYRDQLENMDHIEFMGISGVGKTTLFQKVIDSSYVYGGIEETGPIQSNSAYIHSLGKYLNEINILSEFLWTFYFKKKYYRSFGAYSIIQFANRYAERDNKKLYFLLVDTCAAYEFGRQTVSGNQILALDEGFMQRAASIAYRTNDFNIPLSEYITRCPQPSKVIYVDAPDKIINKRRKKRNLSPKSEKEFQLEREFFSEISDLLTTMGVSVIDVQHIGEVNICGLLESLPQQCTNK